MRGSALTVLDVGGANLLRLVSNLILTRLLFPEAFGLMAVVQVFLSGLQMFSDIGITTSILQNRRGDDPAFLNTAWTMQILRGFGLWLGACALAWPAAALYDAPILMLLLPVAGLQAVITGFATTKTAEANRHLRLGRQTVLNLGWQTAGIAVTALFAWWLESVWALVIGGLITVALRTVHMHITLPGTPNRLHWDWEIVREMVGFGRFIFLGTLASFFINQSDKLLLGMFVTLAQLGIYNVGYFLGAAPLLVTKALSGKVIVPLYRMRSPAESRENRAKVLRARRLLIAGSLALTVPFSLGGPPLIGLLYDPRYAMAGAVVSLAALSVVPQIVFASYGGMLLAHGDSRRHFHLVMLTALLQVAFLFAGIWLFGVVGAVLAPGVAWLTAYPVISRYARIYNADDRWGEAVLLALGLGLNGYACYLHAADIAAWLP